MNTIHPTNVIERWRWFAIEKQEKGEAVLVGMAKHSSQTWTLHGKKKEDRDIPKLLTVVFSRGGCIDDLNLIFWLHIFFKFCDIHAYIRWRRDRQGLPISIHYLRKCVPKTYLTHALLHFLHHTSPSLNDFSIGSLFFSIIIPFLAAPTSSWMTHLWIWLHFNFLKCNALHFCFIYSMCCRVIPTPWSSLEIFPRFLI